MKLSQKLLALGGVTLADYACCPYDDYGMPHPDCTTALPEKTPFSMETDWRNGACKAWESNVDATYDGNDQECGTNNNWGSCGFQRHFPWNEIDTEHFRNRNCIITNNVKPGEEALTLGSGCNCQGYGDADLGAIVCQTTNAIIGTGAPSDTCVVYTAALSAEDPATYTDGTNTGICCDPTIRSGVVTNGAGVDVSCDAACVTADMNKLATDKPIKCHDADRLGMRNIQAKKLFLDDTAAYVDGSVSTIEFSHDSDATASTALTGGTESNANLYNLGGVPFLGGVCKLFVPVPKSRIVSVQVAGVHVSLNGPSVFAAKVGTDSEQTLASAAADKKDVGTAYCFSVVNPAEGMSNANGSGNLQIHNGNVAGESNGQGPQDPEVATNYAFDQLAFTNSMTSLERQAGLEPNINFFDGSDANHIGTQLRDDAGEANGDSQVGANFDVVVHIHSEWCNSPSFWSIADMQLEGDYNNNNYDYPLNTQDTDAGDGSVPRNGLAYSAAQTGDLPIEIAFDLMESTDEAQTTALGNFNDENGTNTCVNSADLPAACGTKITDYLIAVRDMADCTADTSRDAATCNALPTVNGGDLDALKDAIYEINTGVMSAGCIYDVNNDGTSIAGCAIGASDITEIATIAGLAETHGTAIGTATNARNAYETDLDNSFTHAHKDLMDKRHNMVADYNDVYQQHDTHYLRFPNSNDDIFKDIDGNYDSDLYAATASFLRWPNAGAFAAFYSFVTCANPPFISNAGSAADVNKYAIIYNKGVDPTAPGAEPDYEHLGKTILRPRTLVMSQTDSDYRDQKCDERQFRGNLRQVGNTVTVCGPGQLPDTDSKRCSWNWNYNSNEYTGEDAVELATGETWSQPASHRQNPYDAEEWFDRNDPHSFDMWSTRKRRANDAFANDRKYAFNMGYWGAQQGKEGDGSNMFDSVAFDSNLQAHANAIQIPITNFKFNLEFKNAKNESPVTPTFSTNDANCFYPGSTCVCRPSAVEFNAAGFILDTDGTALTLPTNRAYIADDYSTWAATDIYHQTACNGVDTITYDSNTYNKCTAANIAELTDNTRLAKTTLCEGFKALDGSGGFIQTANNQVLTFDDQRVKTVLNPSTLKFETTLVCERTNLASLSAGQAQRDFFPDCFFGDEIWFTLSYSSGNNSPYPTNNLSYNSYISAWYSAVEMGTYDSNGEETSPVTQTYFDATYFAA